MLRIALLVVICAVLSASSAISSYVTADRTAVWRGMTVLLPRHAVRLVSKHRLLPAAIQLHGCGSPDEDDREQQLFLAAQGFVVFAPDFNVRAGLGAACGGAAGDYVPSVERIAARGSELDEAIAQVRGLPWIDPMRIVVVGWSEGGSVALRHAKDDIYGIVVLGMNCREPPTLPHGVPTFVAYDYGDETLRRHDPSLRACASYDGENLTEYIADGYEHNPIVQADVRKALSAWLKTLLEQRTPRRPSAKVAANV